MIEHRVYGNVKEISIQELQNIFSMLSYIDVALLFGSRASGNFTHKSDYDIAVLGQGDFTYGLQAQVWADLSQKLDLDMNDIDIVDLQKVDIVLKDSIKEHYIALKGDADEISRLLR